VSKTLFWYVFRDLLRIFFMASGALAGIMSFGGLLRPLTEHGLDAGQVSKMLTYFTPAMTTYSFPVAALFAATMVYGRLSADNELTACRAGGISYLSMTAPALVLGLSVSLISLLFLCFIVPIFTLKVEQTIYSNLAQLVQNQIERTHQIKMDRFNVFAQSARVLPVDPEHPTSQRVELIAPMIVTFTAINANDPNGKLVVGDDFYMAKRAVAYIDQKSDDVKLTVVLEHASRFQRNVAGRTDAAVAAGRSGGDAAKAAPAAKHGDELFVSQTQFGPMPMSSPIKEDAKFMTIDQLKYLYENPEESRRLQDQLTQLIKEDQSHLFVRHVYEALQEKGAYQVTSGEETITLARGDRNPELRRNDSELVLQSNPQQEARQVKLTIYNKRTRVTSVREAMEVRVRAMPRWDTTGEIDPATGKPVEPTVDLDFDGFDVVINTEEEQAQHKKFSYQAFDLTMPDDVKAQRKNTVDHYLRLPMSKRARVELERGRNKLLGKLQSEIHSRASFAISCLVLVLVGCALGMMFRSSNFLSAFAVSFIPAMFSIALIVTGQQVCSHAQNSMALGLAFIWSGNALVLLLAVGLLWKLQRA
jgi:lipopolysaccharide export LptBFGC system permease protein LptF